MNIMELGAVGELIGTQAQAVSTRCVPIVATRKAQIVGFETRLQRHYG